MVKLNKLFSNQAKGIKTNFIPGVNTTENGKQTQLGILLKKQVGSLEFQDLVRMHKPQRASEGSGPAAEAPQGGGFTAVVAQAVQ